MVAKMDFRSDFTLLNSSIKSFLELENTRNKLNLVLSRKTKDWEKWLQLELEYHFENLCNCEAKREVRAISDQRYLLGKHNIFIDLLIRKRNSRDDHYIYVELKCYDTALNLYYKMESDATKLGSIKQSYIKKADSKMRSFWCIGFFLDTDISSVNDVKGILKKHYSEYPSICKRVNLCNCYPASSSCGCDKIGYIIF